MAPGRSLTRATSVGGVGAFINAIPAPLTNPLPSFCRLRLSVANLSLTYAVDISWQETRKAVQQ